MDCLPALRRQILEHLRANPDAQRIGNIMQAADAPRTTVERSLEDLTLLHVLDRDKAGAADNASWLYRLADRASAVFPEYPRNVRNTL